MKGICHIVDRQPCALDEPLDPGYLLRGNSTREADCSNSSMDITPEDRHRIEAIVSDRKAQRRLFAAWVRCSGSGGKDLSDHTAI
jgi:hypothetical protein